MNEKLFRLFYALAMAVAMPHVSNAAEDISLDKYSCAQFMADTRDPANGEKLLKSLMMISWGVGYAAAHQKTAPRADATAIRLIAATLGDACRRQPKMNATLAIAEAVQQFAKENPAQLSNTLGPLPVGQSRWEQNGSIIYLIAEGASRKFYFEKPRDDLTVNGVQKGALLFDGKKDGSRYTGTAYAFAAKCKPRPFAVIGDISADEKQVTLRGKQPTINTACKVTGTSDGILVLTFMPSAN